jgi:GT2 family glycosyltransferase
VLIRREALERIGGIAAIKHALIDDVALAAEVKKLGPIYLGHSALANSIRPYPKFGDIWSMISRTAFIQLRYSPFLLMFTLVGLALVWVVPVASIVWGNGVAFVSGLAAFLLASFSYWPTLVRYRQSRLWCLALPAISVFYMAATIASALNHWSGRGARWKDRAYDAGD